MDYAVVYTSITGNTQKIALEIFEAIPGKSKDIQRVEEISGLDADTYFVGFWNNRGTCSSSIMDFLSGLRGRKVALFGTCGACASKAYFDRVANQVSAFIPDDCEYLGNFMCVGKMPLAVVDRYKELQRKEDTPEIRAMISGYQEALLHPNEEDLRAARQFVLDVLK